MFIFIRIKMFKPLQRFWKRIFRRVKRFRKDNASNLNTVIVCISVVMVWRWVWDLLDIYVFPNNPLLSNVICIVLWIGVLLIDDWKLDELNE